MEGREGREKKSEIERTNRKRQEVAGSLEQGRNVCMIVLRNVCTYMMSVSINPLGADAYSKSKS